MAAKWTTIVPPNIPGGVPSGQFNADTMILLTDGSVLIHNAEDPVSPFSPRNEWLRYTPDPKQGYAAGSWSGVLPMTNSRQFFSSGVLMDGRVFAIGGEDSDAGSDTPLGEIFDPTTNLWTTLNKPAAFNNIQGDVAACILPDGRVVMGSIFAQPTAQGSATSNTSIWDPVANTWSQAGTKFGTSADTKDGIPTDEETWTLLQDGSVMAVEVSPTNNGANAAERYLPATDQWVPAGNTLQPLVIPSINGVAVEEIGPAIVLPDGRLFAIGATGNTAIYTPSTGAWTQGPAFPADANSTHIQPLQTAIDAPAVLQRSGKVICVGGSTRLETPPPGYWSNPTNFLEFDPSTFNPANPGTIPALPVQPPSGSNTADTWEARFLLLPTGEIFYSSQSNAVYLYTPDPADTPNPAWKPTIATFPSLMVPGHVYQLTGTQFNGLSQACSYGDDAQMNTNYPIVQLTNAADQSVIYLRSFNFSTLGIATGSTVVSTDVEVPLNIATGQWSMVVIANGIASDPETVTVALQDCYFLLENSEFGVGEVKAAINSSGSPAQFDPALFVVVEGFNQIQIGSNHPTIPNPIGNMSVTYDGQVQPEDDSLPANQPQRFTFSFKVSFPDESVFAGAPLNVTLNATFTSTDNITVTGSAEVALLATPDPFILHGDTANGIPWYLSADIKVLQEQAGGSVFGTPIPSTGTAQQNATAFITNLIGALNGDKAPAGVFFDGINPQEDQEEITLAETTTSHPPIPVYNFAIARIRYQDVQQAIGVSLFFRMWAAQQTNATYDISTTYRVGQNAMGQTVPVLGLQGDEIITIPFFATPRVDASADLSTQTDPPNLTQTIQPDPHGGEVDTYFGCWLDINQPGDARFPARVLNGPPNGPFTTAGPLVSIQQLVSSAHQCLIAEINYSLDPISPPADPSNSNKLAQRNLTFGPAPNPGVEESRRVPQTFEIRPTPKDLPLNAKPDELMIEWGATPKGSLAHIYLPGTSAAEIIALAEKLYTTHLLTLEDAHTVQCPTGALTYIPIPKGTNVNFAGLLTVDLPAGITKGEVYKVAVRQLTNGSPLPLPPPQQTGVQIQVLKTTAIVKQPQPKWRRTLGAFQLTIPVSTKKDLLPSEERLLSILRWIEKSIPVGSRWFPVFGRYVQQVAGRVSGMGGNPVLVGPNPNGEWHQPKHHHHHHHHDACREFTGKVTGVAYDHFGDFEAFFLETFHGEKRLFLSREERMEELVRRAWEERIVVTVIVEHARPDWPVSVVLEI